MTHYQYARDRNTDGLVSTKFRMSLNQLNKLDVPADLHRMKKWLEDFSQMVQA